MTLFWLVIATSYLTMIQQKTINEELTDNIRKRKAWARINTYSIIGIYCLIIIWCISLVIEGGDERVIIAIGTLIGLAIGLIIGLGYALKTLWKRIRS